MAEDQEARTGPRAWLRHLRQLWRDPARRRDLVVMGVLAAVGFAILGVGTVALVVTRGGSEATAPDAECVRWEVPALKSVLIRTELTGETRSGARCGDPLQLGRIGREGPFRVVVGSEVLWTSQCLDDRSPQALELRVGAEGDLYAVVLCPSVAGADPETAEPDEVNIDALLRDEGYPAFLQD